MKAKKYIWPFVGIGVVILSIWILVNKLKTISLDDVLASLDALNAHHWALATFFALLAYAALAGYDRIALQHLNRHISWIFITLCSFTTYALAHNIGASVFSGAAVRYRAYSSKGLSTGEIAVLVGLCSFTFALGTLFLSGIVLVFRPDIIQRVYEDFDPIYSIVIGLVMLGLVALYIFGSWLQLPPLKIGQKFQISYPRLKIVWQQLLVGPLELIGAAGIIYAALPEANNPGFLVVLGVFLASFSVTLISNAPAGGVGLLELLFISGMPELNEADVLAALIVFRLLYLIIPFILSLFVVVGFEYGEWKKRRNPPDAAPPDIS